MAKRKLRWIAVATTTIKDPRDPDLPDVIVTQLIDQDGQHWERYGEDDPVLIGTPPEALPPKA